MHQVAIIGGGLTGLSTAYYLGKAKPEWKIHLFEKEHRFGGKIKTKRIDGYVVEVGPDSYLARKSAMTDLIESVGLGDTIVENATGQAFIYDDGHTYPIPGGSIVGIPTEVIPFAVSPLLSWKGKLRAGLDLFKKPYPTKGDVSIGDFFHYHLGQEMMDKLIEPLLSGIYGGDIYNLSLDATFPDFHFWEKKHGNMLKAMLALKAARAKTPVKASSQFRQVTGGLESIIEAMVARMPRNVELHLDAEIESIELPQGHDSYQQEVDTLYTLGIKTLGVQQFNRLIITTPPQAYKRWFSENDVFSDVCNISLSSCAIAIMSFDRKEFKTKLGGTGFLITRKTKTPLTACTYLSAKWPQTTPKDKIVLRAFLGKAGDHTVDDYNEEELKDLAVREIKDIMGLTVNPIWVELSRLNKSMPQYTVGHNERIQKVQAVVANQYPCLHIIGTPFKGVGMPDGVKQARELVESF